MNRLLLLLSNTLLVLLEVIVLTFFASVFFKKNLSTVKFLISIILLAVFNIAALALLDKYFWLKAFVLIIVDLHSSIVTNGYYLTSDMAKYLKELNVVAAQVTVDGPPDIHNERRCLPNHSDTFYRILSNISEACEFLNISIRINIDRKNMERVDELLDYFDQYNLRGKVNVYIAAVDDINNIGNCYHSGCLNSRDFSEYESAFYMRNLNRGYTFVGLPRFNGQLCGAVASNSFVIDPLGDLYKCWDEIGIKEKSSGNVKTGFDTPNMKKWTCYNFTYYSECKECAFLPVCLGGCPYHNISSNIMNCATVRYNYVSLAQILNSRRTEAQNVYND